MSSQGWIKLHRRLLENPIVKKPIWSWLWVFLLLKANHAENSIIWNGNPLVIKRGQLLTGLISISRESGVKAQSIRSCLAYLKSTNQITIQTTNKWSLITINNYDIYQEVTSEVTNKEQTNNKQITTNNNDKKVKNEKNTIQQTTMQSTNLSVIETYKELKRPDTLTDHSVSHYIIELFRDINPDVARLHKLKTEADASLTLYRNAVKGNLDQLERAIRSIPDIAADPYCPKEIKSLSKPSQLLTHWALYCAQARGKRDVITNSGPLIL